jgi:predicted nucleotidyltransferase
MGLSVSDLHVDPTALAELCRDYQVKELCIFGSTARGEAGPASDVDLLVEFLPDAEIGLLDFSGLSLDLSQLFGKKVDLVSRNGLKPAIRNEVLREARRLYAQ